MADYASLAEEFLAKPKKLRQKILASLSDSEMETLATDWKFWGRKNQFAPPGSWSTWMLLAGRGFGKTRCGAEWIRERVESGKAKRIALVAPTAADARDTMILGESGLLNVFPKNRRPLYNPSKRRITFFDESGKEIAMALLFSAEDPESLRGPQFDTAWCDELAAWKYPDTWDMLQFGLRLGNDPQAVVTTTPKPNELIKGIIKDPGTVITRGSTMDNAKNLAKKFIKTIKAKYEGTRLGRQELYAEVLDDNPGALWNRSNFEANRLRFRDEDGNRIPLPEFKRIVVAVDPAVTSSDDSDETGIIVAALGVDGRGYVLEDLTCKESPAEWAKRAYDAYVRWGADRIVVETNQGGDLIETTFRAISVNVSFQGVRASKGKFSRAEPVAALYEQNRISHVGDGRALDILEDQMCNYNPDIAKRSPDRMDALVWAFTALMLENAMDGLLQHYKSAYDKAMEKLKK